MTKTKRVDLNSDNFLESMGHAIIRLSKTAGNTGDVNLQPALLTLDNALRYLDVGKTSFYRLINSKEIPKGKSIAGRPHWRRIDLDKFIDSVYRKES